jgi:nicotinamide riboside kinase
MKIAVVGSQNTGKTTYVSDFIKKWNMYKTPEKTYRDIIKEKNLSVNENGTEESQKIILDVLVDQAIEYSKKDFVILDRSVLDNLAYTSWLNLYEKVSDKFLDQTRLIVRETLKLYDILFFLPLTKFSNIEIKEDGLRSIDPVYRQEIDTIFKAFQESYNRGDGRVFPKEDAPAFIEIFGNPEERIKMTEFYLQENGTPFGEDQSLISDISVPDQGLYVPKKYT